ncbi:uncharacterized protein [Choristoneura fumiferana]|uniref:uncharacterized protein n=1 Tax=Choristoneura fumiferana TaxID=7141 RepID=UPI003D156272
MEAVLETQKLLVTAIQQVRTNFKKDGPERKTAEYVKRRIETLDSHWNEFQNNHNILAKDLTSDHDYFKGGYYQETRNIYLETRELMNKSILIKPATPLNIPKPPEKAGGSPLVSPSGTRMENVWEQQRQATSRGIHSKLDDMIKKQMSNFKAFARTVGSIQVDDIHEKWEFEDTLNSIKSRWKAIDTAHWEIDSELDGTNQEYERLFSEQEQRYNDIKRAINSKLWSVSHREKSTPQLDIPIFSGNYQQWVSFKDLFCEAVHNNPSLSSAQKMQFLKGKLRGEAERLIQHLQISSENYQASWEILNHRYHNQKLIFTSHMNTLMNIPVMQHSSAVQIKRLHDVIKECLNAIKNLGVQIDTWDPILIHILSQKLDAETHKDYMESLQRPRDLPEMSDFLLFLENKFTAMESLRRKQENGQKPIMSVPTNTAKPERSHFRPYHSSNKAISQPSQCVKNIKLNCAICNSNEHRIYYCGRFLEMSPSVKRQTIAKLNFCNNCLFSHNGKPCTSNNRCRECNGNHNTILHDAFARHSNMTPGHVPYKVPPTACTEKTNLHVAQQDEIQETLLATALIQVWGADAVPRIMRAIIDQGSQISLITEHAAQILGLPRQKCNGVITGVGSKDTTCKAKLNINCSSMSEDYSFTVETFIMRSLTRSLPHATFRKPNWDYLHKIKLADPDFNISRPIDILLGVDIYSNILLEGLRRANNLAPIAQQTRLGWILCGKTQTQCTYQCNIVLNNMEDIQRFWQIEDISESDGHAIEDSQCIQFYKSTTTRRDDGRYEVRLPLKPMIQDLGESKHKAIAQFMQLERKFNKNKDIAREYKAFIEEYRRLGHMTPATQNLEQEYFMPHHCVIRNDSLTTMLRVVYNASERATNGVSLNDCMYSGPNLQQDLLELILKWRQHRVAFTADIEKMFRQIWVHPKDQHLQKIIWRDTPRDLLQEYQLTTVTYGTKAAPFLAMMTLRQLAEDEKNSYPDAAQVVKSCFYMDDLIHGAQDVKSANQLKQDLIKLLQLGGFNLRKWNSNYQELLQMKQDKEKQGNYIFKQEGSTKTLGIHWDPEQDSFVFQSKLETQTRDKVITKRILLSDISKLFDPAGWLTPVSIKLKILFQKIWEVNINWDDKIPENIHSEWIQIRQDLANINQLQVQRWLGTGAGANIELHGYCDASQQAYAAVIYCKQTEDENSKIVLVAGKSRLVPHKKKISLPRLELCGALLLSKLMHKVKQCLPNINIKVYGWTDSTAVLGWLQGHPERWTPFVSNRVRQINEVIPSGSWQHVKSSENPADCASRGLTVAQLKTHPLWWQGPTWLPSYKKETQEICYKTEEEVRKMKQVGVALHEKNIIQTMLESYSSFNKVTHVLAWIRRFLTRKQDRKQQAYLTLSELKDAKIQIIKLVQAQMFSEEIESIKKSKKISKTSKILGLDPFLDDHGLLRVGGRLKHAQISPEMKNPIILPYDNRLTRLIIDDAHKLTYHGGTRVTLAFVRQKYWVISGNRATKKFVRQCVTCKKHRPYKQEQLMGDLPGARVNPSRPFYHTGVDFTGHVYIKANKGRGIKTTKGYVAVFVCLATKAVHLELVSDLTASAFIAALRRMSARRGTPRHLYSDNGRNFVGANRIIQEEYQEIQQVFDDQLKKEITELEITWHFNAPSWPSASGLFEAAVKSFKYHFKRVIGEQILTFEEFSTLLSQIEACLNSRPLCPISEDPEDLNYLTPSHFLASGPILTLIETERDLRTRWKLTQKIFQDLWKRWRSEYLTTLTSRCKWKQARENVRINDVVLIHDDNMPPGKWLMGRIVELHPGQDGLVRVVTLKTKSGYLRRPVTKISILTEGKQQDEANQSENKQQEKSSARNRYSLTSMFTAILFFMTLISSSNGMISTTEFRENQGLYFDKVSNMQLIRSEWKLVVFYELKPYWQGIEALQQYISTLDRTWTDAQLQSQFSAVLLQLRHGVTELEYYNQLLMSHNVQTQSTHARKRRGIINAIGYLAGDLFGVLDERFAEQYKKDIQLIRLNQKHIVNLWKNQTSIVEAQHNLLRRVEVIMNQQHKELHLHMTALENSLQETKKSAQTNLILNELAMGALVASNMLNNLRNIQNALLETVTDIYHGRFNLHLLTPAQLIEELSKISSQLEKDVSLPVDNIHFNLQQVYGLLKIKTRMLQEFIIFEIKLPLISRESYEIFKIIPIKKQQDDKMVSLVPISSYVAINIKKDTFITMTENDVTTCYTQSDSYFCPSRKPEYLMTEDKSFCELENFECKTETEKCKNKWEESYTTNTYVYFCCGQCQVRVLCGDQISARQLTGAGLMVISHGCLIKTDKVTIYPHKIHSSEMKKIPELFIPTISPINHIINITLPHRKVFKEGQVEFQQEEREIDDKIKILKKSEDEVLTEAESISYHDIHQYVMIYAILFVIGIIGVIIIIRRWQCRWQVPRSTARESPRPATRETPSPVIEGTSSSDQQAQIEMRQNKSTSPVMLTKFPLFK